MGSVSSDRNLLLGILALQMELIDEAALIRAVKAWVFQKSVGLEDLLLQQQAINQKSCDFLRGLVQKHLELHDNNAAKGLASLSAGSGVRESLRELEDDEIDRTLQLLPSSRSKSGGHRSAVEPDPDSTIELNTPSGTGGSRFRILRPHARGGIGKVSVAEDTELHREVALKEIQDHFAGDPEKRSRFLIEAEVTGRLEHPGIVPVYGLGQTDSGTPFYVMKFIRGDSLREALARLHDPKNFPNAETRWPELRKLVGRLVDVCHAVAYAHSRGVLHRDLKPGNIMLGKYGETLVVDWGLAKVVGRRESDRRSDEKTMLPLSGDASTATQMGSVVGTVAYMSPEQAEGRMDKVGPLSDVYSLGATLYSLLTGKSPIAKADVTEMLEAVTRGSYSRPSELADWIPRSLEAVCLKAMSLRPEDRYSSPLALAEELELWLADEPVSAYQEPWAVRLQRWSRRNRALIGTSISALAATTVAALVVMWLVTSQNAKLRAKNLEIELAGQEILKQRDALEKNRETLSELSLGVLTAGENDLKNVSGTDKFRSSVMERSYETFRQLHQDNPSDQKLARNLAEAARLSGNQLARISKRLEATDRLKASVDLQRNLLESATDSLAAKDYLAGTLRDLGNVLRATGRLNDARRAFADAAKVIAELLTVDPQNANYKRTAAVHGVSYSGLLFDLADYEQSVLVARDAAQTLQTLSDSPDAHATDHVIAMLGIAWHGRALDQLKRHSEAREVFLRGITKGRESMQRLPGDSNTEYALSRLQHWDTDGCVQSMQLTDEKITQLDEAIKSCEKLQKDKPASVGHMYNLGFALCTRGRVFREKMQYSEANEVLQKSEAVLRKRLEAEDSADSREILSVTICEQAETQLAAGNKAAALELWKTAVKLLQEAERLSQENPLLKPTRERIEERTRTIGDQVLLRGSRNLDKNITVSFVSRTIGVCDGNIDFYDITSTQGEPPATSTLYRKRITHVAC